MGASPPNVGICAFRTLEPHLGFTGCARRGVVRTLRPEDRFEAETARLAHSGALVGLAYRVTNGKSARQVRHARGTTILRWQSPMP